MNLYVIHARLVRLADYDVVNPFLVVAAADAVERMGYTTLASAKNRVHESELVVGS